MALTRVCLDTSAYCHFKRGEPSAVDAISSAGMVFLPVIVLGELRTGFRLGGRPETNERELREFLAHPAVAVLEVDDDTTEQYAELVVELRRSGTPLPTNDIWIGAVAIRAGVVVVSYDQHFEAMQRVGSWILRPSQVPR